MILARVARERNIRSVVGENKVDNGTFEVGYRNNQEVPDINVGNDSSLIFYTLDRRYSDSCPGRNEHMIECW